MKKQGPAFFHKLYGIQKPRANYYGKDFLDYTLMVVVTALIVALAYGPRSALGIAGLALCAFAVLAFALRHGTELQVPLVLRRPQDLLYMLAYKLQNLSIVFPIGLAVLLLENVLIAATPRLPHHVAWMRTIGSPCSTSTSCTSRSTGRPSW
jgi:hypothetical protein